MTKTKPMTKFVWLKQTLKSGAVRFIMVDVPPDLGAKDVFSFYLTRGVVKVSRARHAPIDSINSQLKHTRAFKSFLNERIAFLMESKKNARK